MRLLFDGFQPSVVIDFHHQGSYVDADGDLITGSVLFEMRGGIGTKSNGYITKTAYNAAKAVVAAMADGTLFDADIAIAENLPPRGPGIGAPNDEAEEVE